MGGVGKFVGETAGSLLGGITGGMSAQAGYQSNPKEAEARKLQLANIKQLQGLASGAAPSAAAIQGQQAREANINSAMALANSARGPANTLNQKGAVQAMAQANQQALQTQAATQAQEQMAYQQLLANQIAQQRSQDLGIGQMQNQIAQSNAQGQNQMMGGLLSGAAGIGAAAMMSDKNVKKDIKDADSEITAFMDNLDPKSYKYKDEKHGKGKQVGIMAQDLEKSKKGKEIVAEGPEGKMVSLEGAVPKLLAAVANLNDRIKKMEK